MIYIYNNVNKLKSSKHPYCFRSRCSEVISTEEFIRKANKSTVTPADMFACLELTKSELIHYVSKGFKVHLPIGDFYLKATGTTENLNDGFLPGKGNHKFTACFDIDKEMAQAMEDCQDYTILARGNIIVPGIEGLYKIEAGNVIKNDLVFPRGSVIQLKGHYLSLDINDEKQGIFLKREGQDMIRLSMYTRLGNRIVQAVVDSSVPSGQYKVMIVTKPGPSRYEQSTYNTYISVE